jgi:hypothetical protein
MNSFNLFFNRIQEVMYNQNACMLQSGMFLFGWSNAIPSPPTTEVEGLLPHYKYSLGEEKIDGRVMTLTGHKSYLQL